jgi:REP element-mobilizing transposase RayT
MKTPVGTGRDLSLSPRAHPARGPRPPHTFTIMKKRKNNRLSGFDYSAPGYYFVTICTQNRWEYFGEIENNQLILNESGKIVAEQWLWLEKQYPYVDLDEWVVMPNHFHGIIAIDCNVEFPRTDRDPLNVGTGRDMSLRRVKTLSELIGAFKTTSSKLIHQKCDPGFQWQRSFHDRIIRNEHSLNRIRQYVIDNPLNWEMDRNNLVNVSA